MGVTSRLETTTIDDIVYATKKFDATRAFNLYAVIGSVIPEPVPRRNSSHSPDSS